MTPRNRFRFAGLFLFCFVTSCEKHTTLVEFSPDIPPPTFLGGGTCDYRPTNLEKKFYDKLSEADRITIQNKPAEFSDVSHTFKLEGHGGVVSWWGIVRDIKRNSHHRSGTLLIENKYFDGLTDCNFQSISINGGGDFEIGVTDILDDLVPLVLIRVYGTVTQRQNNRPFIQADYVRVWHWGQFRFWGFGEDHGNPEWKKNAKLRPDENPYDVHDGGRSYYSDHLAPTPEQSDILRPFYQERTTIEFANIPLDSWGETAVYKPSKYEKYFYDKLSSEAQRTLKSKPSEPVHSDFQLQGHVGQFVSWFGIVREVAHEASKSSGSLLIENKYFRASKDEPPQTVSINGSGDFRAILTSFTEGLPLSLVRVYGTVIREVDGAPVVQAEYIRVWRWGEFDFDDYGLNSGDPRWSRTRKLQPNESVQQAQLSADYYLRRLGPTTEQAQTITEFFKQLDAMQEPLDPSQVEEIEVDLPPTPFPKN